MFTTIEIASDRFYNNFDFSIVLKKPLAISTMFLKVRTLVKAFDHFKRLRALVNPSDIFLKVMRSK